MEPPNIDSELEQQIRNRLASAGTPPPFAAMWSRATADVRRRRVRRVLFRAAAAVLAVAATWTALRGPLDRGTLPADAASVDFAVLELEIERHFQQTEVYWSSPTQFLVDYQLNGQDAFDELLPAVISEN